MSPSSKPPECQACPAHDWGISYVPPRGPAGARIAILGQGPGEIESQTCRPFTGSSGRDLDRWIRSAGGEPSACWIDNVVRCWLPKTKAGGKPAGNRAPRVSEIRYCFAAHAGPALRALRPRVILATGVPAAQTLLGRAARASWTGNVFTIDLEELTL